MPIYEYRCSECGEQFEKFVRSMNAEREVQCPKCQSEQVEKQISLFGASSTEGGLGLSQGAACAPSGGG